MINFKKMLLLIFTVTTVLLCFTFSASAIETTGQCGDNVFWNYDVKTSELVISGNGETTDYESGSSPFYDTDYTIKTIVIEDNITSIGDYLFEGCSAQSVIIGKNVTTIGEHAFSGSNVVDIEIPNNVITIKSYAFECSYLSSIELPNNLTCISEGLFIGCFNLTNIDIPNTVTTIELGAFAGCDSLESITIPNSVSVIGKNSFDYCRSLTEIKVLNSNCDIYDSSNTIINTATIYGKKNSTAQSYAEKYERAFVVYCLHENKEQRNSTNPSCTGNGYTTGEYCPDCEIWISGHEVIPATNHKNKITHPQQNATCTEIGYESGVYCLDCKLWLSGHDAIPATNHKNNTSYSQQNATCTENGYTAGKYCPDCKSWIEGHEIIPALNHKNKISHIQQNPTCTEIGYTAGKYCPDCKVWLEGHEVIPALNHKNKTSHIQQNPTCIEIGYTAGTYCPDCKVWLEGHEVIPVLGHTEVVDKAVLATEKENGLTEGSHCSVCSVVLVKQEIIPAVLQYNGSYYTVDPVASGDLNNAITLESGQMYCREYTSKYHSRYWYAKFTIKENSYASIGFTAKYYYEFSIRDENGFVVKDFGSKQKYDGYFPLEAGTYYVVLNNKSYSNNSVVLSYSLFENVFCEREPNDTFTTATTIGFDQKYLVFSNDSYNNDYLSFNTKKGQKITVYVYGFEESNPSVSLYESDRNTYYSISMNLKFDEKKKVYYYDFTSKYDGIYFIKVNFSKEGVSCSLKLSKSNCSNHSYKTNTVKASLSKNGKIVSTCSICGYTKTTTIYYPKSIKLSATSYTYNGKTKTPSVTVKDSKGKTLKNGTDYTVKYSKGRKSPGKYTVTITFKGKYTGTKKLTFTIKPAKVTLSKFTAGSKKLTVTWKAVSGATGYEVQYSTSKKFTKKTTKTVIIKKSKTKKTTIKKLKKGKKYYVKVRAYKTVGKVKIYGSWSKGKSVTIK